MLERRVEEDEEEDGGGVEWRVGSWVLRIRDYGYDTIRFTLISLSIALVIQWTHYYYYGHKF